MAVAASLSPSPRESNNFWKLQVSPVLHYLWLTRPFFISLRLHHCRRLEKKLKFKFVYVRVQFDVGVGVYVVLC